MKLLTALTICACAGPLSAASFFTETFSTDNDTSGFFHVSTGSSDFLNQDPVADNLQAGATDFSTLYIVADSLASGGAFVGAFPDAGPNNFLFDLTIASGSAVTNLFVELSNLTDGETWTYNIALPAFDTTTNIYVPLDGVNWTQSSGSQPFSYILGNTEELAIGFGSDGSGSLTLAIDNVQYIPEPASMTLLGLGALLFAGRRRRNG